MPRPKKVVPNYNAQLFKQWSCNQSVGCLQWLGSKAYGPVDSLFLF